MVNWAKTKTMHVAEGCDLPLIVRESQAIEFVPSFNYLNSVISSMGSLREKISYQRNLAVAAMNGLWKPLWWDPEIRKETEL